MRKTLVVVVLCLAIAPLPAAAMQGEGSNAYYSASDGSRPGDRRRSKATASGWPPSPFSRRQLEYGSSPTTSRRSCAAHIHCAGAGEDGPVGVTLFSGEPVTHDGILVDTQRNRTGPGQRLRLARHH